MKAHSERGVALVITLVMLSLVTFMAVVFLAISRREKASVAVTGDITTARLMADTALARAQSEIASRILARTNRFDYDLLVSTNYFNPGGFIRGNTNIFNVNYDRTSQNGLMSASLWQDWAQNIANLQIDPRPPVVYPTNQTGLPTNDFRFYLDLNRNGYFEPTGLYTNSDLRFADRGTNFYIGDPQWIGVLEYPDRPHSESNRFIGRYAYVVLPAGKSLDLNFIHNAAKRLQNNMTMNDFLRHQGVGSWEINLAGFFSALNTNVWVPNPLGYNYNTNLSFPSSGTAFDDARMLLRHRYEGSLLSLASARAFFATNNPFPYTNIDNYSDGPLEAMAADNTSLPWSGSSNTNGYYDIQELFDPYKTSPQFVNRFTNRSTSPFGYDRYTFYRLLAQMGTDSRAALSNKVYFPDHLLHDTNRLHLSYINAAPFDQDQLIPWDLNSDTRTAFFTNAADRMLRATLDPVVLTSGSVRTTNFMLGLTGVRDTFSCTNIQLYHLDAGRTGLPFWVTNNEYTATTHRLLQLAANIHDATTVRHVGTTNDYPSVFRPVFLKTRTNLVIRGFVEENNANVFLSYPWMTIEQAAQALPLDRVVTNVNLHGVPLVIGAKKGYPNFNKLVVQSLAEISRRLEIRKASPFGPPVATNQMYVIGISNRFGVEGWNSYTADFNRNLELRVTNHVDFVLSNRVEGTTLPVLLTNRAWTFGNSRTLNTWPGSATVGAESTFIVPVDTNFATLPNQIYLASNGRLLQTTSNYFERSFRVPQWTLRLTNNLQYILIDRSARPVPRIIDYVSLAGLVTDIDLSRGLTGDTNAGGGGIFSDKSRSSGRGGTPAALTEGDMWNPAHVNGDLDAPTVGVLSQISVSKGIPYIGEGTWRSSSGQLAEKDAAIHQFVQFMSGGLTNLSWQVPFTPSRRLYQRSSWEANDPLVHYTVEDLTDPTTVGSTNLQVQAIPFTFPFEKDAQLRELNRRYRPWGGKPDKDPSNDPTAYAMTLKDPLIRRSDDWQFPTNRFANLGWLGRVHRGTPWQTMYLKAAIDPRTRQPLDLKNWALWSGSFGTHPTNDWKLFDLFTVAPNENASRGLLSVNQTNLAAWSAVLSGVSVLTNISSDSAIGPGRIPQTQEILIQPNTRQLQVIVDGINRARAQRTNSTFQTLGDVLSAPELTVDSPYLNRTAKQYEQGIDDAMCERIPQQILSLLRTDEARVVVYAFGQSLKPAPRSLFTDSTLNPPIFNLCTNYQVTGEFAAKTVLRLEELPPEPLADSLAAPMAQRLRAVVESYSVLQPESQ